MDEDLQIKGGQAFAQLGKALKQAGDGRELRKEFLKELRAAGKPVTARIRRDLGAEMPKRGGLAAHLSKAKVGVRNRLSGDSAGVRLEISDKNYDLPKIEKGIVRHPTYGHGPWVSQPVKPNVVTDAIEAEASVFQTAVLDAIDTVVHKIEESIP
jgi:hypothetical protein